MRTLLLVLLLVGFAGAAWAEADTGMFDPRFREGAPSDRLVEGPPRLSRGHLNAFVDLFEAAFDLALPAETEQRLRDALETRFEGEDREARERFLDLTDQVVNVRRCARCCKPRGVRACLRAFRAAVDARVAAAPEDPVSRILVHVLDRRHRVVWLGSPEVKALAADAYVEMVVFVASLGRNETIRLSAGQRSALQDYLGRDLKRLPETVRERLALSHRRWLLVKARWDRGRDRRRLALRWRSVGLMARLVPKTGGLKVGGAGDHKVYAREASKVRVADRAFDAVTALARNPELLQSALAEGLALQRGVSSFTFMYR